MPESKQYNSAQKHYNVVALPCRCRILLLISLENDVTFVRMTTFSMDIILSSSQGMDGQPKTEKKQLDREWMYGLIPHKNPKTDSQKNEIKRLQISSFNSVFQCTLIYRKQIVRQNITETSVLLVIHNFGNIT